MSRLFGVTTDYLLKDEIEEPTPSEAADVSEGALRRVSMEEAARYIDMRRAAAPLEQAGGRIVFARAPALECASSDIRAGKIPPERLRELLPPPVPEIIETCGLYPNIQGGN